jgi:hypothetical protein
MPRKVVKREKEQPNFLKFTSMAIVVIGVLILLATAVTWQPYDVSSIATRLNLLTLFLGIMLVSLALLLLRRRHKVAMLLLLLEGLGLL